MLLVGCDFSKDGTAENPTLQALRAVAADPGNPAVILLTSKGSEYTAVQAIKSGAFDYVPEETARPRASLERHAARDAAPQRLLGSRGGSVTGVVRLFGYDMRRCLATHESVSVHVAFSAERGKEVVLKVLHRGRGALSRDANFERLVTEFKLLYDIDDHAVAGNLRFPRHEPVLLHRDGVLSARAPRHAARSPLSPSEALHYAREIAHGLSIIHTAGVIHRDLKPGNIMLRDDDSVALIDFGISQSTARARRRAGAAETRDRGHAVLHEPRASGRRAADERTDLYSLGVILYQMLTGEKPYVGATTEEILEQHRNAAVPTLPPRARRVPAAAEQAACQGSCAALRQRPRGARGVAANRGSRAGPTGEPMPALAG